MSARNILVIGGLGVIGNILNKGLSDTHSITNADIQQRVTAVGRGIPVDISDYDQLLRISAAGFDTIINLTGITRQPAIIESAMFHEMLQTYVCGMYNVLLVARELKIPRVIFASSNHVTGEYEDEGISKLGRSIHVTDYPAPDDIHGVMKLFGEQAGKIFSSSDLSVICLRLGTVLESENLTFSRYPRLMRTLLSHEDLCHLFECALSANVQYGIYYGVSDNPEKPWSIEDARRELNYKPGRNSLEVFKKKQEFS